MFIIQKNITSSFKYIFKLIIDKSKIHKVVYFLL